MSVLNQVAHHLVIHKRDDLHVVQPYAPHDGVERG